MSFNTNNSYAINDITQTTIETDADTTTANPGNVKSRCLQLDCSMTTMLKIQRKKKESRFYVIFPSFGRLRRADSMNVNHYTLAFEPELILQSFVKEF